MIGIKSYGSYVPFNRLTRKAIADVYGKKAGAGEKAVANYDEDSITMAVAAALDCVRGFDVKTIGGCYFASTTAPYLEKACAGVVAAAVDLKKELRSADFSGTLRCGSSALMAALDLASTGKDCLVSVADTRLGAADGANEMNFGDAAAAFLVGSDKVIAEVNASPYHL